MLVLTPVAPCGARDQLLSIFDVWSFSLAALFLSDFTEPKLISLPSLPLPFPAHSPHPPPHPPPVSDIANRRPKIAPLRFCLFGCEPQIEDDADLYKGLRPSTKKSVTTETRPSGTASSLRLPSAPRTLFESVPCPHRFAPLPLYYLHNYYNSSLS
jgi:hypothetical protein